MKLLALDNISDGMILAKNAYAREGNVLLAKGAPLRHNYAKRLQDWGIFAVYVQDSRGDSVEIDEKLLRQVKEATLRITDQFLADFTGEDFPESLKQTISGIISQLLTDKNILAGLVEIKVMSGDVFEHSVKVSILAMLIGSFAGYGLPQLQELGAGAILIDLGQTALPNQRVGGINPLALQDSPELQQHPKLGLEKLLTIKGDYRIPARVVLEHHEKYDGSGFPQGLKGVEIHEYARITAIADCFYSHHPNERGEKESPEQVIDYIIKGSGGCFDPEFTRLFAQKMAGFLNNPVNRTSSTVNYEVFCDSPEERNNKINPVTPKETGEQEANSLLKQLLPRERIITNPEPQEKNRHSHRIQHQSDSKPRQPASKKSWFGRRGRQKMEPGAPLDQESPKNLDDHKIEQLKADTEKRKRLFEVTPERCQQAKTELLQLMDQTLSRIRTGLISKQVLEITRATFEELVSDNDLLSNLATIQALDDNTFPHCASVGLLSVLTGASIGYSPECLKELGLGSLLVDLGKVELAKRYRIDAGSKGTPEYDAIMPQHTQFGFEKLWALKRNTGIPYIALQHHERYDGSGFPAGLKGGRIHEYARIVALADTYETLISEGINGRKMMPHEVIEYIRDFSGSHFDPELSRVFLENVTPFLIGTSVLLNTGEKATVVQINKELLARPVIRVMFDGAGNKLEKPIVKDLEKDLTLFIVSALPGEDL